MAEDFLSAYLDYTSETEIPAFFNRWCAIAGIGALLGRQYYLPHSHSIIYPNIYCMLIGSSGTKKSTAIKLMKKLLRASGYTTIAASKTTKEKFLLDLAGESDDGVKSPEEFLDESLFGNAAGRDAECFIMADEFNDFFGNGNIEFISLLGNLWDYEGVFDNRIKTGKSVSINNPTISILGGNTPTNFSLAFPTEVLGQGFFSRLLLIYGEPNGRRIAFPVIPTIERTTHIISSLTSIKRTIHGEANLSTGAKQLLNRIYEKGFGVDDVRFESYSNRRFQHLIKLCLIVAASRMALELSERDIIYANTILSYTESLMPKALGEFGRARNSDVTHTILDIISRASVPVTTKEIWKEVRQHLDKLTQLVEILMNLQTADKILHVKSHSGWLGKRKVIDPELKNEFVDYSLLTPEERGTI